MTNRQFANFNRPVNMDLGPAARIVLVRDDLTLAQSDSLRAVLGADVVLQFDPAGASAADLLAQAD